MEKENVQNDHKNSLTMIFRAINTIGINLVLAGIFYLINHSMQTREDIMVIKEKIQSDQREILNLRGEYKKLPSIETNIELIKKDVEVISTRVKKMEDRSFASNPN